MRPAVTATLLKIGSTLCRESGSVRQAPGCLDPAVPALWKFRTQRTQLEIRWLKHQQHTSDDLIELVAPYRAAVAKAQLGIFRLGFH
jgi:hypothetical protein